MPVAPRLIARTDSGLLVYSELSDAYNVESVYLLAESNTFTLKQNSYSLAGMIEVHPGDPPVIAPRSVGLDRHGIDRETPDLSKLQLIDREIMDEVVEKTQPDERDHNPVLSAFVIIRYDKQDYHIHVMASANRIEHGNYRLIGDSATATIH